MLVPLCVPDFINRAVQVYGERIGVVDEPDQPATPLGDDRGELTYAQIGALAKRQAAKLDELGIGAGDRVAVVSHNSSRLLTSFFGVSGSGRVLVPVNFRLRPEEVRYIVEHSGARVLLVDPELQDSLGDIAAEHRFVLGDDGDMFAPEGVEPQPWGARRERHRDHQLHLRHHRAPQGRPDHPPQHLDQRGHLRDARDRQ